MPKALLFENRIVLTVGSSAYAHASDVLNPVVNATDVAAKIEDLGCTSPGMVSNLAKPVA